MKSHTLLSFWALILLGWPIASFTTAFSQQQQQQQPPSLSPAVRDELVAFANELADQAADAILPYWRCSNNNNKSLRIESKQEAGRSLAQTVSPVTAADRAAEAAMRRWIETRYPSHGIIGEEYGSVRVTQTQTEQNSNDNVNEFVWVLDPIDGTKSFITGKPTWGTLIACLYYGEPTVGVIDHTVLNERWVGATGRPTTLNGQIVRCCPDDDDDDSGNNDHSDDSSSAAVKTKLADATLYTTTPDMFRVGYELNAFYAVRDKSLRTLYGCDCYAYALVASGFGADAVVEADLGLYDYCATVPVVQGAGGIMTDWRGEPLCYANHEASQGRVVASTNEILHAEILGVLQTKEKKQNGKKFLQPILTLLLGMAIGSLLPTRSLLQ